MKAIFKHINIVARDLEGLCLFYQRALGCRPLGPVRELSGSWLDEGIGLNDLRLKAIQLRLPGIMEGGPTLEIFQFSESVTASPVRPDRAGLRHLAFEFDDVDEALREIISHGGRALGRPVSKEFPGGERLTFVYATDPEGNIIELLKRN